MRDHTYNPSRKVDITEPVLEYDGEVIRPASHPKRDRSRNRQAKLSRKRNR